MRLEIEVKEGSELLKLLANMQQSLEDQRHDIDNLFTVWHTFSEVATEHLSAARASVKPGEDTIWF